MSYMCNIYYRYWAQCQCDAWLIYGLNHIVIETLNIVMKTLLSLWLCSCCRYLVIIAMHNVAMLLCSHLVSQPCSSCFGVNIMQISCYCCCIHVILRISLIVLQQNYHTNIYWHCQLCMQSLHPSLSPILPLPWPSFPVPPPRFCSIPPPPFPTAMALLFPLLVSVPFLLP